MEKVNLLTLQEGPSFLCFDFWFSFFSTTCNTAHPDLMYGNMYCADKDIDIQHCQNRWKQ